MDRHGLVVGLNFHLGNKSSLKVLKSAKVARSLPSTFAFTWRCVTSNWTSASHFLW